MPKRTLFYLFVIVFFVVMIIFWPDINKKKITPKITSFEECAAAGYPIMESYPEQCNTPDGRNFVKSVVPER
jgi:hypothetical protein